MCQRWRKETEKGEGERRCRKGKEKRDEERKRRIDEDEVTEF